MATKEAKTETKMKVIKRKIIWTRRFVAKRGKNEVAIDLMEDLRLRGLPWKAWMTEYVIDPTAQMEKIVVNR